MGFDVTMHPVSLAELDRFIFQVVDNPLLVEERVAEISTNDGKREALRELYVQLAEMVVLCEKDKQTSFSSTVAFVTAAICGYLHPYWYFRNVDLGTVLRRNPTWYQQLVSLTAIAKGRLSRLPDKSKGRITANYCAGGILNPDCVCELRIECMRSPPLPQIHEMKLKLFPDEELPAFMALLEYCTDRDLYIFEATDLVVPIMDQCYTDFDNIRATFLDEED